MEIARTEERLIDDPVAFEVRGCVPGERITVSTTYDVTGARFSAEAEFTADDRGVVSPGIDASRGGDYLGADPYGLWWSGNFVAPAEQGPFEPVRCAIQARGEHEVQGEVVRRWLAPETLVTDVSGKGFVGHIFRPAGEGPFPAVVAFGGSGGGLGPAGAWGPLLASRGVATLALAYFGAPGLPNELVEIEVEVVKRAIDALRDSDISVTRVAVMGQSRGSELALLAASLLEDVAAAVIFSGSGLVWSALGRGGPIDRPAWMFRGDPIPYLPHIGDPPPADVAEPFALTPLYRESLAAADHDQIEAATIGFQNIGGPVLAVSGEADAMWPSVELTESAERSAQESGFPHGFTHLRYADAGHTAPGVPGLPIATEVRHPFGGFFAFGGSRAAVAHARADSWPRVVDFLRGPATPP